MAVWEAVGAIAAAAGAGAAWRAALASQRTSEDAREALAVGIEPQLSVVVFQPTREVDAPMPSPTRMALVVLNSARWPAADLDLTITYADGDRVHERNALLDPMTEERDWILPLRD